MNIEDIHKNIDLIDAKILRLLNDRMEKSLMAGKLGSRPGNNETREDIPEGTGMKTMDLVGSDFFEALYDEIRKEGKRLQGEDFQLIAFQGEHGAFGEVAAKHWNSDLIPIPHTEFVQIFEGVESGLYDCGIVPVENAIGSVIGQVNDLLINRPLKVTGAVEMPIHLCLLALPEMNHRDIRVVHSHPQVLAQCRHFLARNHLESVPFYDIAGAAKMVAEMMPQASAAIASSLSAELYNLEIIKENLEDQDKITTRFLILSREEESDDGDKCSIIFSTEHRAGTLFSVLEIFAKKSINLTRIESVSIGPGNYAFFLDFMGSSKDEKVIDALQEVTEITTSLKLLGCYKEIKVT